MLQKYSVCKDEQWYLAWPDVALTKSGKLVCVFSECTHHGDRSYTRIMLCDSNDRGRTWGPKRPLSDAKHRKSESDLFWNCARITALKDGRLVAVCDLVAGGKEGSSKGGIQSNWIWISDDEGKTWTPPREIPVTGIVPDKVIELNNGDWIVSAHTALDNGDGGVYKERAWITDDKGITWSGPFTIAAVKDLMLCEGSVMQCPDGTLACFMRENSGRGLDCYKSISHDGGRTWEGPYQFPLPGCHRPVAGMLADGAAVLITHRFMQGGKGWLGSWTQNFFAAFTDVPSALAVKRNDAWTRIFPIDYDRSAKTDLGYSGWVQFDDGEIYIVNYIVDDWPRGQIRGYSLSKKDYLL
ncbi:MAG: exo-alpha-sialidase [Spirochaetes bacterium]|nr:exo-alpha-sialidase [Spirochaetota bacterium]